MVLYPPGDPSHFVIFVCMLLSWLFHVNCYISSSLSLRMVLFSSLPSGLLETVASVSLTTILPSVPTALCLPAAAEGRECQAGAGVALVVAHAPSPGVGRGPWLCHLWMTHPGNSKAPSGLTWGIWG